MRKLQAMTAIFLLSVMTVGCSVGTMQIAAAAVVPSIHVKEVSNLAFSGTPSVTATTATSAATPFFVNGNTGYAALNGEVIKTVDGGKTWAVAGRLAGSIQSLAFSNPLDGVAVIEDRANNTTPNQVDTRVTWGIFSTVNGGKSWNKVWSKSAMEPQFGGYMANNFHLYLFGSTGYALVGHVFLITTSGGRAWKPVKVSGQVEDAVATGANHLWVATSGAPVRTTAVAQGSVYLFHSTDGGRRFTRVLKTPPMTLWEAKLSFDGAGEGVLLVKDLESWETTVYYTTDSGKRWGHSQPTLYDGRVAQSAPVFGSKGIAYVALDPGAAPFPGGVTVLRVKTGKATLVAYANDWRSANLSSAQRGALFAAASLNEGRMALFRSDNQGKSWHQVYPV